MIKLTFSSEDPKAVRSDMAAMLGVNLPGIMGVSMAEAAGVAIVPEQEATDKPARGRGRPPKDKPAAETAVTTEPLQGIQTGGERVDPNAGKVEEKVPEPKKLTLDDVRDAAKAYIAKFGMPAAQNDLQFALEDAVGDGITAISKVDPDSQEMLAKAVKAFEDAAAGDARYVSKKAKGGAL